MESAQYALYVVHELYLLGVHHFCISPGSRSTSLVLAIEKHPNVTSHIFIDERSSGFFALGLAKSTQKPVAVITTSGTAMANVYPAVIEAYQSQVPLVCISADRPFDLRNSGANQTINQIHLFGTYTKFFSDIPPHDGKEESISKIQNLLYYALDSMYQHPIGPIHLNFMFQKPFEPVQELILPQTKTPNIYCVDNFPNIQLPNILRNLINNSENILFVFGKQNKIFDSFYIKNIIDLCGIFSYVDVSSSIHLQIENKLYSIKNIFETINVSNFSVVYFGETPLFENILKFPCNKIVHITKNPQSDPFHNRRIHIHMNVKEFYEAILLEKESNTSIIEQIQKTQDWLNIYDKKSKQMRSAYQEFLETSTKRHHETEKDSCMMKKKEEEVDLKTKKQPDSLLLERECIEYMLQHINSEFCIFVSNSMPIRYLNDISICVDVIVGSNRGASGIDGIISSSAGFCYGLQKRGIVIVGDLACWHDLGSFLQLKQNKDLDLLVLILNNHGGGIFEYLPVSNQKSFSSHFATQHQNQFQPILQAMGIPCTQVTEKEEYQDEIQKYLLQKGLRCIEVITDARYNMEKEKERDAFYQNWLEKNLGVTT